MNKLKCVKTEEFTVDNQIKGFKVTFEFDNANITHVFDAESNQIQVCNDLKNLILNMESADVRENPEGIMQKLPTPK